MTSEQLDYLPSVGRLLGFTTAKCGLLSGRRLKKHGLTLQQWVPMTALWRNSPMSESELSMYCKMSPSSMNRLLDRMVQADIVCRERDPNDKRRVLVRPTEHGESLNYLLEFHLEINEVLLAGMLEEERAAFIASLQKVMDNLDEAL